MDQRNYQGTQEPGWSNNHSNHGVNMSATYSSYNQNNERKNHTYGGMQNNRKSGNKQHNHHNNNTTDRYKGIKLNNCSDNPALDVIMEELYHIRRELRDVKLDIQDLKARRKPQPPKISVH